MNIEEMIKRNNLGKAAEAGHKAKDAIKNKKYDEAWEFLHEQKIQYMEHANLSGFTAEHTLSLDAKVHEDLANVLRLENKHNDALVHILYWVIAQNHQPIKRHEQKLTSYFKRCKLKSTTLNEVIEFSNNIEASTFTTAKNKVATWLNNENK